MQKFSKQHIGVLIGRFQPIHKGHMSILLDAINNGISQFKIFVGSVNSARMMRNPFTYEERTEMIFRSLQEHLAEFNFSGKNSVVNKRHDVKFFQFIKGDSQHILSFELYPLNDSLYNDLKWALEFNTKLDDDLSRNKKHVLLGFQKDSTSAYLTWFPELERHFLETPYKLDDDEIFKNQEINATTLRNMIFLPGIPADDGWFRVCDPKRKFNSDDELLTLYIGRKVCEYLYDFYINKKDVYEYLVKEFEYIRDYRDSYKDYKYPPTFVTVDALVVQDNNLLLIKRRNAPGKDLWALPGGFLNQKETILDGMIRELREETGLKVPEQVLKGSIKAIHVEDNPARSERGRVITHCHYIHLASGYKQLPHIRGASDASKAQWMPLKDVANMTNEFFEDHFHIIDKMLGL